MQYKTIMLELLQQRPQMHERLRKQRKLLPALELYARELKRMHEGWKESLIPLTPHTGPEQISAQALELAIKEMEGHLPSVSAANEEEALSLDQAMAFIRRHTSRG